MELGETANGQDAKTAAMSLLGGGSCSNAAPLFVPEAIWYAMHAEHP